MDYYCDPRDLMAFGPGKWPYSWRLHPYLIVVAIVVVMIRFSRGQTVLTVEITYKEGPHRTIAHQKKGGDMTKPVSLILAVMMFITCPGYYWEVRSR